MSGTTADLLAFVAAGLVLLFMVAAIWGWAIGSVLWGVLLLLWLAKQITSPRPPSAR